MPFINLPPKKKNEFKNLSKDRIEKLKQYKKNSAATKARQEFYSSSEWKKIKKSKMQSQPICPMCWDLEGKVTPIKCCHHKKSFLRKDNTIDWEIGLDYENLVCLCTHHHSQLHYHQQYGELTDYERNFILDKEHFKN